MTPGSTPDAGQASTRPDGGAPPFDAGRPNGAPDSGTACAPSCAGKHCGDSDGCGHPCTHCPSTTQTCNVATGQCQGTSDACTPSCGANACGSSDGCGGQCTNCADPTQTCNPATGACVAYCVPNCAGKTCGDSDGCGATCTQCPLPGQGCNTATGTCTACSFACGNGYCAFSHDTGGPICHCDPGYYFHFDHCEPVAGSVCDGMQCLNGTCALINAVPIGECVCDGDRVIYGNVCIPYSRVRCVSADGTLVDKGSIRCSADDLSFEVCRDPDGGGNVDWVSSGPPSCAAGTKCSQCITQLCDNGDGMGGTLKCPPGTICMGLVHQTPVYQCVTACDCSNCGTCDPGQFTGYQRSCGSTADNFTSATVACASPCPSSGQGCLPYGVNSFCFENEGCASAAPP